MKVKVIWSLTVFQQILLNIATVFAVDENSLSRSAYFTTRQNKKLIGHVVQRFESPSLMSCSHSCMRNMWCSSTNFEKLTGRGDKGTCELNKHDIPTVNKHTNFQDRPGSTFSFHLKGCLKNGCLNGGSCLFDERKDTFSCSCKISWTGKECQVKTEPEFHFTTLNTTGKEGPTSKSGYKGSSLENVSVTNGLQEWSAPFTGYYHVDICGASGGGSYGGKGARVSGRVHLHEGTKLIVLVGQRGIERPFILGSGGGGSFVVFSSNGTPLTIAGGGGGQPFKGESGPGQGGEAEGLLLGVSGQGGRLICTEARYWPEFLYAGFSGGGYRSDGKCFDSWLIERCNVTAAKSFLNGGRGGSQDYYYCCDGGFGGGGASSPYFPGGGGGYSGGSVNGSFKDDTITSGGGGSFVPSEKWNAETGTCDKGDGYVTFRFLGYNSP